MANDNNIQHFTAADIERYHKGLLSGKERHDLEKAALDDPFLADALEGYTVAGVHVTGDIAELKKRLAEKTGTAKVIPFNTATGNNFRILRAAVIITFLAGAGLLIYQFGFNKKSGEIAQAKTAKEEIKGIDSGKFTLIDPAVKAPVAETKPNDAKNVPVTNDITLTATDKESKPSGIVHDNTSGETPVVTSKTVNDGTVVSKPAETQPVISSPPPAKVAEERREDLAKLNEKADKKEGKRQAEQDEEVSKNKLKTNNNSGAGKDETAQQNRSVPAQRRAEDQNFYRDQATNNTNVFRGRVTDADNNGVPFANVTNVQDNNAGTYTDARGFFNLTYPDSVLTVQVRSIGFENNNVQLRNSVPTNKVVLQDDRKTLSEVTLSKQKPDAAIASKDGNMKLDEPVPADGWDNYGTYLTNNLEVPQEFKNKSESKNEVLVSFEVDKNGEPVKLKVEKSLCDKCDKEAIRLVKEGPKWKRNTKKARTTVTIYF
ncbi:MAG: carboxypeptidase-like regulatory domain-containing protein [Bacteroidota bacterium]